MTGDEQSITSDKTSMSQKRPWWREPAAIGICAFTILASSAVLMEGYFARTKPTDPTKPTVAPNGGTFCDTPSPVHSTAYNPSTRKTPPKEESQAPF